MDAGGLQVIFTWVRTRAEGKKQEVKTIIYRTMTRGRKVSLYNNEHTPDSWQRHRFVFFVLFFFVIFVLFCSFMEVEASTHIYKCSKVCVSTRDIYLDMFSVWEEILVCTLHCFSIIFSYQNLLEIL